MLDMWYDQDSKTYWEPVKLDQIYDARSQENFYWDTPTELWWCPSEYQHVSIEQTNAVVKSCIGEQENFMCLLEKKNIFMDVFVLACKNNHMELAKDMIDESDTNVMTGCVVACKYKNTAIVEMCLQKQPSIINADDGKIVYYACKTKNVDLCILLLANKHLEITANLLDSIIDKPLCDLFFEEVLNSFALLLKILKKGNSDVNNELYLLAIENGMYERYIMISKYVTIDDHIHGEAMYLSTKHGHIDIVEHLVVVCSVDPCIEGQYAFETACKYGKQEIVNLFLERFNIDVNLNNDNCLRLAVEYNQSEVVDILLRYGSFINSKSTDIYYKMNQTQLCDTFGANATVIHDLIYGDQVCSSLMPSSTTFDFDFLDVCLEICWEENKIDTILCILKDNLASKDKCNPMANTLLRLFVRSCEFNILPLALCLTNLFTIELDAYSICDILPSIQQHVGLQDAVLNARCKIFEPAFLTVERHPQYIKFLNSSAQVLIEKAISSRSTDLLDCVLKSSYLDEAQIESLFDLACDKKNLYAARLLATFAKNSSR
tara:strand:+ start:1232 stop:2872 length:1641 start_codon:yes stop_codon:yes gene_type:complete